ncbi:T9SS sorting signal type C domain-containing protein [Flavobacterium sp. N502540]|uniref:T9SS sorting signal type C domain-containing protein n=1 Tax=Flavobacterium sp. N502540 TaxID=2986838 RepID=UPI002224B1CE|nr:T9SS sorting signal type C domain-containing protein [Flavobacterium sp. N502540]
MRKYLLTLQLFALPLFFYAQTKTVSFSSVGTNSFYVPAGVSSVTMSAWGGGGAGGGSTVPGLSLQRAAGGGGGGAFAGGTYSMNISIQTTLSITVGKGGAGVLSGNGGAGDNSSITGYLIALAGNGGAVNNGTVTNPAGGAGGLASGSTGATKVDGVNGGAGETLLPAVTGAGGAGGTSGSDVGGAGGASITGLLANSNGNAGTQPGGGGSGGKSALLGSASAGGAGGTGKVVIVYTCPTYSLTSTSASTVNICTGTSSTITLNGSLPVGTYSVAYQVDGVTQTPVSMTVSTSGTGAFTAPGFSALGSKSLTVTSLTSGTSGNSADNCASTISANNTASVNVTSSGTAPVALAGSGATCTQITANWQVVSGSTYYTLDLSTDINFGSFVGSYNGLNVGNVLTVNITGLSNATTYYYRVRAFSGTCLSAYSNTITYKPAVSPGNVVLQAATNTSCTAFTANWSAEANAVSYLLDVSLVNTFASTVSGYNALDIGNVTTYTVTGLTASTTYYYRLRSKNGCGTSATGTATVQNITTAILPGTPLNDPVVQPTCDVLTGTVVLKNLPNRNDYTITQTGTFSNTYSGGIGADWTKYTITGLAPGTYNFTVQYPGTCASLPLSSIVVNALATNTYTIAGGWSLGTPTVSQNIVFADDFSSSGDVNSCGCTINAGKNVTINTSNTLTVRNALIVDSAPGTTLTFKTSSSLVQVNNAVNSGNISYERTSPGILKKDYLYWSTPVSPQRLIDLSSGTSPTKYFGFDGTQWVSTDRTTNMVVGKGYIIRGPETYSNTVKAAFTGIFSGVPNNGSLEGESLSSGKSYLIGNPYPSALNADALISTNSILGGTIYFWTHNTPVKLTYTNQYTADDYASYNLSGGVSAKSDPLHSDIPANDNGIKPTGKIAAGQSFFVTTVGAGKVQFNNSMRLGGANNNQFFKSESASKETTLVKKRIWLNMTNTSGAFKQLLVGYVEGATNEYDSNYDGISFNANPYLDFYSVANGNNYVIQGRALPFVDTDLVPLGYRTTIAGDFTISIDEVDDNMSEQAIYIEDKTTGEIHNLKQSNYTFTTEVGTFLDRLVLRYTRKTLGVDDFENTRNAIVVSVKNRIINVSSKEQLKDVFVYDVSGKLLYSKSKIGNKEFQIQNLALGNQMVLVKVILENDATGTRKIAF